MDFVAGYILDTLQQNQFAVGYSPIDNGQTWSGHAIKPVQTHGFKRSPSGRISSKTMVCSDFVEAM